MLGGPPFFPACLLMLTRTSNTTSIRSGDNNRSCLLPSGKANASSISQFRLVIFLDCMYTLCLVKEIPFYGQFDKSLNQNPCSYY